MGSCCSSDTKTVKIKRNSDSKGHQVNPDQYSKATDKPMTAEEVIMIWVRLNQED